MAPTFPIKTVTSLVGKAANPVASGAGLLAGASLFGDILGAGVGLEGQRRSIAAQQENIRNALQWRVADAKKAGVNPMFAIGAPSGPAGGASLGPNPIKGSVSNAAQLRSQIKVLDATAKQQHEAADNQHNQAGYNSQLWRQTANYAQMSANDRALFDRISKRIGVPVGPEAFKALAHSANSVKAMLDIFKVFR